MKVNITFASSVDAFHLGFAEEASFSIGFEAGMEPAHCIPYDGDYEVVPKVSEQVLATADRHMRKNLVVQKIPYFEVDNIQAGQTAIIGE